MEPFPPPRRIVVLGDILMDMVSRPGGHVSLGVDTFTSIHTSQGGSAANVASRLGELGIDTVFVGKVGDDPFGEFLEKELLRSGVKVYLGRDPELPTGKVFVLVDGEGERTMITDRGASDYLSVGDLPRDVFAPGAHLHLTGYMFSGGPRRECALEALGLAREAGMSVSVDPSSAPLLADIGAEDFFRWTTGAELCLPNLPEGRLLTGMREPRDIASRLLEYFPAVVLKLGAEGAVYAGATSGKVKVPAARVEVRDTTGAGDALCAGFLAGIVARETPEEALRRGTELAGRVVRSHGAAPRGTWVSSGKAR